MNLTKNEALLLAGAMENKFTKTPQGIEFTSKLKNAPEEGVELLEADINLAWAKMEYSKKKCLKGKYFEIKEKIKNK